MKNRAIILCAVVFSAIGFAFSSERQKAENFSFAEYNAKCAVPTFNQSFQNAKSVFIGEVISEKKNGDVRTFKFKAEKYWKGSSAKNITINAYETMRYQAWFKVGGKYLIFADEIEGKLRVGRCSRSKDLKQAKDDLKLLGKGKKSL